MSQVSMVGTGYLNNGPGRPCQVIITTEMVDISTGLPKPDHNWSYTDGAGHFHAYDQTKDALDRYPTLKIRIEEVPCGESDHDSDCDGANIRHYHCRLCDEELNPGLIPGPHYDVMPGLSEWEARITVELDDAWQLQSGAPVSFRGEFGDTEVFGLVTPHMTEMSSDRPATVHLWPAGQIGRRTKPKARD